ncbi:winged helix-turn-helix transcriptional regulator [Mycoplasma sp. Z386]
MCKNKINYNLQTDQIDDKHYLIIAIKDNNNNVPFQTIEKTKKEIGLKPGWYIRIGRDTRLPKPLEEFELLRKFANYSFSSNLNHIATIDDLNYEYMKEYLILTNAKKDIIEMSKIDMAKSMGLISDNKFENYRAKNFAVLMFAENPSKFIPNAFVKVIREVDGTDKMEEKIFDGPIWLQVKQVNKYFENNIMTYYTIREDNKIEHKIIYNYPLATFKELATNAILHKEYENNEFVGIYIYKDRISFINHNKPLPPVTIESLNNETSFDQRKYINNEIKNMFFALKLIESYGSGIRRAKSTLLQNNSPKLLFSSGDEKSNFTNAIIKINEEFYKNFDNSFSKKTTTKTTTKTTLKYDQILNLLEKNPLINTKEISEKLNITIDGVRYHLRKMKKEGLVRYEGSSKLGKWVIKRK